MSPHPRRSRGRLRRGGGLVTAALALAMLAACGGAPAPAESDGAAAAPAASGAFPVTIPHSFGETTVPAAPQRVVTLGFTDQDAVLALGVVPVGTTEWYGEQPGALFPWARAKLGDAPLPTVLSDTDGIPFEQVAALQPDLILSLYGGLEQSDYDTLSAIAPTIAQPADHPNYGIPWDVQTRTIGTALGRSAEADRLVADVEQQIADARAAHPEFQGKTAMTAGWFKDQWYVYSTSDQRGRILEQLGFTVPPEIDQLAGDKFGTYVSFERADLLDVDALVWVSFSPTDIDAIKASPGYANSAVVTEGRAIYVRSDAGTELDPMGGFITVLSLPHLLDALPAQLTAAVDGDPATTPPAPAPLPQP